MLQPQPFRLQRWNLKLDFIPGSGVFKGVLPEWLEHWEMTPRVIGALLGCGYPEEGSQSWNTKDFLTGRGPVAFCPICVCQGILGLTVKLRSWGLLSMVLTSS